MVIQGGNIWAVNNISVSGAAALRWYRFDRATNLLLESGVIGDPSHDYYYGSIAVNPNGNIVIGYTRSGPTEHASAYASVGDFNGSGTTFGSPTLLQAGVANYNLLLSGLNRWGDYSATVVDPGNPNDFWTFQEWASGPTDWSTQITEISTVPEPASALLLGIGLVAIIGVAYTQRLPQNPCYAA